MLPAYVALRLSLLTMDPARVAPTTPSMPAWLPPANISRATSELSWSRVRAG